MAENLDKKVEGLINSYEDMEHQEGRLVVVREDLAKKRADLKKTESDLKRIMIAGQRLSNPVLDYCFYHFGINAQRNEPKVKKFCSRLKDLVGQAILINYSGGAVIIPGNPNERFEREIRVGRLIAPGYSFSLDEINNARNLVATVKDLEKLDIKTGVWQEDKDDLIGIWQEDKDDLIIDPEFSISPAAYTKIHVVGKQGPDEIISINLHVPEPDPDPKNLPIGQTTIYDSDIYASLKVGDEIVERYLKDSKIILKKTIIPQVPKTFQD